ncbi:T9SS type A sorting domain-containing protein [Adhaeribacter soli]|uniref:T9SS type A sorting domain-containing protein n=1 Tax=Adhaeribacter soli TaxID=2607655 RepID=A0A5N1IZ97_9BACT|nr:T9SS type A sorting domain-containing protein [Adhaeribacter soli]KAA9333819.1 T9SS type A sorting domain-containing protein [Adhaeribacter soli]
MKTPLLAFLALLLFSVSAPAQVLWSKTYGTPTGVHLMNKMTPLQNGGYLLAGVRAGYTYIVRTDTNGDTTWTRSYLLTGFQFAPANDVAEDTDGNLIVIGSGHKGNTSNYDGFIMKLKPNGDTLWTKQVISPQADSYGNVIIANDGNYLVTVVVNNLAYLQKLSKGGNVLWTRSYMFSTTEQGGPGAPVALGNGYFIFIYSGYQTAQVRTTRIDESGNEMFSHLNYAWGIYDAVKDPANNMLVCGAARLFKMNPQGDTLWSIRPRINMQDISIMSAKPTQDGNYIAVFDRSNGMDGDVGLMKVAPDGTVLKDTVLYRFGYYENSKSIVVDANGDYIFSGYAQIIPGQHNFFLAKHHKWNHALGLKDDRELASSLKLYPNPAQQQIALELEKPFSGALRLYNLQGQKIWQQTVVKTTKKVVPLNNLPQGIYLLQGIAEDGTQFSRKVVKK